MGALLALLALLRGAGGQHAVWCFARLEEEGGGGGACAEPLGDDRVPLADCCLNPAYGYKLRPHGHCHSCRVGQWGPWAAWSRCSVTCGEGTELRGRSRRAEGGGASREWELRACHMACCPVPGSWSPWGPWGGCSVTCGAGRQSRRRGCDAPPPQCGGNCGGGPEKEERICNGGSPICPVGGAWGPWSQWEPCGATCRGAGSSRSRKRKCDSPAPSVDPPGKPCEGKETEKGDCPGLPPCPVDGAWGPWAELTPCPVRCGIGAVTLRRSCDSPAPQHGGRGCHGNATRRAVCGPMGACPAVPHWGPWSSWTHCERRSWGDLRCKEVVGQQKRTRECVGRDVGSEPCPISGGLGTIQLRACYNVHHCPLSGSWTEWGQWGLCHPPCGANPKRSRFRDCRPINPNYPLTMSPVGSAPPVNVTFWGEARPHCAPLLGQTLKVEETRPCLHPWGCPTDGED